MSEPSHYNLPDADLILTFKKSYVNPLVCFALSLVISEIVVTTGLSS